jgi:hypothetical protein
VVSDPKKHWFSPSLVINHPLLSLVVAIFSLHKTQQLFYHWYEKPPLFFFFFFWNLFITFFSSFSWVVFENWEECKEIFERIENEKSGISIQILKKCCA